MTAMGDEVQDEVVAGKWSSIMRRLFDVVHTLDDFVSGSLRYLREVLILPESLICSRQPGTILNGVRALIRLGEQRSLTNIPVRCSN